MPQDYHEPLRSFVFGGIRFIATHHECLGLHPAGACRFDSSGLELPDWQYRTHYIMESELQHCEYCSTKSELLPNAGERSITMSVWILIDRGEFNGVYATPDLAKAVHARTYAYTGVSPTWSQAPGSLTWHLDPCGLGTAVIIYRQVVSEQPTPQR